eukprot:365300-Chlamydomonas_euryale.AAC.12
MVAEALVAAARKRDCEHLPEVCGAVAAHAEAVPPYRSGQMAVALVQEFVRVEPHAYDDQASGANAAAVSAFSVGSAATDTRARA